MTLYIKYMVSFRCKMIVKQELKKLRLHFISVEQGVIDVKEKITKTQRNNLHIALLKAGLELMDNKKAIVIEKIKNIIIELIHHTDEVPLLNFSDFLSKEMQLDYTYLTHLFTEVTGGSIERFITAHKIERIKEFLIYNELNISEISYKLHYSSVAHLCNQFKKETGVTPTFFKNMKHRKRTLHENIGKNK